MAQAPRIKKRLHLDFHNHPTVKGIGSKLTPDSFRRNLEELGIDSVVLFAKCHHGMSYYPTMVAEPHPGMAGDLLSAQVEACEKAGIEYHFYLSVLRENYAFDMHPEWRWIDANGNPSSPDGEWRLVCLNAGYYRDYLKPQIEELLDLYPGTAGIWLDIIRYKGNSCFCPNCVRDAQRLGLSPQQFNERMLLETLRDLQATVRARGKELTLNTIVFFGNQEWRSLGPIEVESILAHVGPFHFPLFSRYLNRYPTERFGVTHSFYQNWREFGTAKHPVQMEYEVCQMAFAGFGVSLGDELEPDGRFDPRRFPVLKAGNQLADRLSDICDLTATPVPEIAVLASESGAAQEDGQPVSGNRDSFVRGALKALLELHFQVAILDPDEDLRPYKCLIAQAGQLESEDARRRIDEYVSKGGKVLIFGSAGPKCLTWLGLKRTASGNADYQFLELEQGRRLLVRTRMENLDASGGMEPVGWSYLPYGDAELGERERACLRPVDPSTKSPSVFRDTRRSILYCLPDIPSDCFDRGNWADAHVLRDLLALIDIEPMVSGDIPASAEVSLYESDSGLELRVLDCSLKRENVIFAQQTEYGVERHYKLAIRTPAPVTQLIDKATGQPVPFTVDDGIVKFQCQTDSPFLSVGLTASQPGNQSRAGVV